ncbi:hypothetical protein COY07_00010 [Candidatus Peregrinibacteria bacterium CG_4_10_14_0_2_um_filter_43_11]|nr:MAG: hypothetical protein COY07_00010 [Candidatus Peregrinibacteria bacterium CG_4_10_14_0_2_um_filter_43_11]
MSVEFQSNIDRSESLKTDEMERAHTFLEESAGYDHEHAQLLTLTLPERFIKRLAEFQHEKETGKVNSIHRSKEGNFIFDYPMVKGQELDMKIIESWPFIFKTLMGILEKESDLDVEILYRAIALKLPATQHILESLARDGIIQLNQDRRLIRELRMLFSGKSVSQIWEAWQAYWLGKRFEKARNILPSRLKQLVDNPTVPPPEFEGKSEEELLELLTDSRLVEYQRVLAVKEVMTRGGIVNREFNIDGVDLLEVQNSDRSRSFMIYDPSDGEFEDIDSSSLSAVNNEKVRIYLTSYPK